MKKSVILVIAVVYLVSVILIGFYGINVKVYNETTYVSHIECLTEGYTLYDPNNPDDKAFIDEGFDGYINVKYTEGLVVNLKCIAKPDEATNKELEYRTASTNVSISDVKEDGTVDITFSASGTAIITVVAKDGQDATLTIRVRASKINL